MSSKRHCSIQGTGLVVLVALLAALLVRPAVAKPAGTAVDLAKLDAFVRAQVERHGIPGLALAVVDGDQIVHLAGYGTADQSGRAVTPQTPFVLASASKPITALAVMQLVEAGKVELEAPVQRYLPDFQVADPVASQQITVRHLLQHTSGLPEQGCQNFRFGAETLQQFVAELRTIHLAAPAGARYFYCSGNYNVLGRIIEVVSGQSYADYIAHAVFAPLNMRHSFTAEAAARRDGLAQGFEWFFGLHVAREFPYDVPQMPSGFLIASAEDMAHFLIAQLNGGSYGTASVLSAAGIAAMHAPGVPTGTEDWTYGLGWRTEALGGVPVVLHTGDHPDAHTMVFMEPATHRGAVLLANANNVPALLTAFKEIEAGVARLLADQAPAPAPWLSVPRLYLIVDTVLGSLLALALWPLLRLRRWSERLHAQPPNRSRLGRIGLRLTWELALPISLLVGARLFLSAIGAQSWAEGMLLLPDFVVWLWAIASLLLLTPAARLGLLLRVLRHTRGLHSRMVRVDPAGHQSL